jgi:DNA-binding Lrp family transcriptional regulator
VDTINKEILNILTLDARTPYLQIAQKLNVSEGMIRQRVKKLVENGEIKKFTINTNRSANAIIGLKINTKKNLSLLEKKLIEIGAHKISHVSGRFDLIVETYLAKDELNEMLDKIRVLNGIIETETFMVLRELN